MIREWRARYVCTILQFRAHFRDCAIEVIRLHLVPVKHTMGNLTLTEIASDRDRLTVQLIYLVDEFIDC